MTFDMTTYRRLSEKLEVDDIDFGAFHERPLAPDALRCLRSMHDVENHTICYLRDVLVTRAHRDPEVTSFLTLWNYEEFWHGEAIAEVLEAHDECAGTGRIAALRQRLPRREAWKPLTFQLGSALTPHLTAVHMTWGAVNEWTTQAAYARLGALEGHPVLSDLLRRIMKQEGRHIDFYAAEARRRLGESPRARRLTRLALHHLWRPVGSGVMPEAEVAFLARHLFCGTDGRAAAERIDRRVDLLPGQEGLGLVARSVERLSKLAEAA